MSESIEDLKAQIRCAEETLKAWFDTSKRAKEQIIPALTDALSGYLRTCRCGGMPDEQSSLAEAVLSDFLRRHAGEVVTPIVENLAAERSAALASTAGAGAGEWQPIETAPKDGSPVDLWIADPKSPKDGYREANARWAVPDHTCGDAGRHCDSCPPTGKQWCDEFGRWIEVGDPEEGGRQITHWCQPVAPDQFSAGAVALTSGAVEAAFREGWRVNAVPACKAQDAEVGLSCHPEAYLKSCEDADWEDSAAHAALITAPAVPASPRSGAGEREEAALGWLFHNPDTGTEWSSDHPIESGEVPDAEEIRPATLAALKDEMLSAWQGLEEEREAHALSARERNLFATEAKALSPPAPAEHGVEIREARSRWLDWRGAVEGIERSKEIAAQAVRQVRENGGDDTNQDLAETVCWMLGLDHLWQHVEALRAALAAKQAPDVATALRREADRLIAKADDLTAALSQGGGAGRSERAVEIRNWQPIETAPSDGRTIIAFGGRFDEPTPTQADGAWWNSAAGRTLRGSPTHWMPLPPAPAQSPSTSDRES